MKATRFQNISLFLFFFSLNFEVWDPFYTDGSFSVAKLCGIIYFLSIIPNLGDFILIPKKVSKIIKFCFLFYLFVVIMNFLNINPSSADVFMFSLFQNIIIFVLILNHERLNPGIIEKSFFGFMLGSVALATCFYFLIGVSIGSDGRVSLFGDNENVVGVRMAVSILFLTHVFLKKNRSFSILKKILYISFYFLLFPLLLSTGSRVAFLSVFIGLCLFFLFYKTKNWFLKIIIIIAGSFLSTLLFDMILDSDGVGKRLSQAFEEKNVAGRDVIWKTILPLIEQNWLYGVGRTGYVEFMTFNFSEIASPHNVVIEVLAYGGIIGLSIYLLFIYKSFAASFVYYRKTNEIIPFIFIIPIIGLLFTGQLLDVKLGWIIFAYSASKKIYIT